MRTHLGASGRAGIGSHGALVYSSRADSAFSIRNIIILIVCVACSASWYASIRYIYESLGASEGATAMASTRTEEGQAQLSREQLRTGAETVSLSSAASGSSRRKRRLSPWHGQRCGTLSHEASKEYCSANKVYETGITTADLSASDAVISIDHLLNHHWCPLTLNRMRQLDADLYSFLDDARARGALIIHAVSDNKRHYLLEPEVLKSQGRIRLDSEKFAHTVPKEGRDWSALKRDHLRALQPPPPSSLSLDRVCGDAGRVLFSSRRPRDLPGLNATRIGRGDVVTVEQDGVLSSIEEHPTKIKRILMVGVHLDLCLLYSRWFSALRIAKFWTSLRDVPIGIIANLVDTSARPGVSIEEATTGASAIEVDRVQRMACWIRCVAAPEWLPSKVDERIRILEYA